MKRHTINLLTAHQPFSTGKPHQWIQKMGMHCNTLTSVTLVQRPRCD